MSKAFTKDDDDAGFSAPVPPKATGVIRLTSTGARLLASNEALARAEVLPPVSRPKIAALGVTVEVTDRRGERRSYRLVTAEERALLGDGCSIHSPIGRALLGARIDNVCEVTTPRGTDELRVVALGGES